MGVLQIPPQTPAEKVLSEGSEDTLLVSFPRSGNTFLRYVLEVLTRSPTEPTPVLASVQHNSENNHVYDSFPFIFKTHYLQEFGGTSEKDLKQMNRLVFLLRHPGELFIRHNSSFARAEGLEKYRKIFSCNWQSFAAFKRQTLVIRYEDLMVNDRESWEATMWELLQFLGEVSNKTQARLSEFGADLASHRDRSKQSYRALGHPLNAQEDTSRYRREDAAAEQRALQEIARNADMLEVCELYYDGCLPIHGVD